jgi:precorrin isomerase
MVKINISEDNVKNYDFWKTILKSVTYTVIGTAGTTIIQLLNEDMDLQKALVIGVSIGVVAGLKNAVKFLFDVDLDLAVLKK